MARPLVAAALAVGFFASPAYSQDPESFRQGLLQAVQNDPELRADEDKQLEVVVGIRTYAPLYRRLIEAGPDQAKRAQVMQEIEQLPNGRTIGRIAGHVLRMHVPGVESRREGGGGGGGGDGSGERTTTTEENNLGGGTGSENGGAGSRNGSVDRIGTGKGGGNSQPNEIGGIPIPRRRAAIDAAVELNPQDTGLRFDRAVIYYRTGDNQTAFDDTMRLMAMGDRRPRTLTLGAQAAAQLGDYKLANELAAEALQKDPSNRTAGVVYELSRQRASRVNLAGRLPKEGQTLAGSSGEALAQSLAAGAPPAQAGVLAGGGAGTVSASQAQSLVAQGEMQAIASQKANVDAARERESAKLTQKVKERIAVKDYEAAKLIASEAIDRNPRNAQALNYRAIANTYLNRLSDAVVDASAAIKLVPSNAPALQTRSWAFNRQGRFTEGLADATATIEIQPENAQAHYNASWAYAGLGQRERSLESLKRAADRSELFKPAYQAAIQAPEGDDLLFLFRDQASVQPLPPAAVKRRFLRFALISLSGGLLIALALLHLISASWREKVNATVRRVLGSASEAGARGGAAAPSPLELAGAAPAGAQGIWAQYAPLRTLGQGGMGVVYEALDRSLDRKVAVKKMRDEIRTDPAERQRFVTEARTVAGLHHPNIVEIFSIVEDAQDVYLVFEYVPGSTLADKLKEGPLDLEAARKVLAGACAAVEHAHKQNVIHRDIKPSNIMLGENGEAKVMDFGVARQAKDAMTKMSMTNTIVGTPPYMAPEQEQGSVRKESDVFALGVCFFEMLTGELPFAGVGAGMLLNKINGRFARLSQKAPSVPAALDDVLAKALAGDPDKRYRTPSEFLAACEDAVRAGAGR